MKRLLKSAAVILVAALILPTAVMKTTAAGYYEQLDEGFDTYAVIRSQAPETAVRALAGAVPSVIDFIVSDYSGFLETIARKYVARDQSFTIKLTAQSEVIRNILENNQLWDEVFTVDLPETVSDLDYLRNNMKTMKYNCWYSSTTAVFEFTQTFLTTEAQEKYVNTQVSAILSKLSLGDKSAYGKIKAVYDYIVDTVDYDRAQTKFSAYDALYSRSAVCQGYALLMYKMLMEAGVPAWFVSGDAVTGGERGPHAWNIVKIGQYWYNLDITWDDSYGSAEYFLKSGTGFPNHFRDNEFATAAFNAAYPMSPNDFDPTQDTKPVSGIALLPSESAVYAVGDVFMLSAVVTPADATDKTLSWSSSDAAVATVDSAGTVTINAPGTAVITASANDGTGKTAGFTLTARFPATPNAWAVPYISALSARGVIPPELSALYRDNITRAEFIALIANVCKYAGGAVSPSGSVPFTDISGSPYKDQIALCYQLGIVEGDGKLFRPDDVLTREQCAKVIGSIVGAIGGVDITSAAGLPYTDVQYISAWALPFVRFAYETGLMLGSDGHFNPKQVLTREQAMTVAERMIAKYGW